MSNNTLVQAEHLENFFHALFVHAGMAPEPARDFAKAQLWAELRGIDAHGRGYSLVSGGDQRVECMPPSRWHGLALVARWRIQPCRALGSP